MKKTLAIFAILFQVASATQFWDGDNLTRVKRTEYCNLHRMQSKSFEFIDLNSVAYVRPIGYRLNFPLSVIVNKTGAIILSTSDSDETSSFYEIQFSTRSDRKGTWFLRNHDLLSHWPSFPSELVKVNIAVTDSNKVTVTIDGEPFVTYHETNPFAINYIGFAAPRDGDEALFYYNCQSKSNSHVNPVQKKTIVTTPAPITHMSPFERVTSVPPKMTVASVMPQANQRRTYHQPGISNGSQQREGEWPWLAAIWLTQDAQRFYACGGTLISSDAVLTAAHCLYKFGYPVDARRVSVQLGKHYLHLSGQHTQEFLAHQLIFHHGYNPTTFQNDVAIIRLASDATITPYVHPASLWGAERLALEEVIGRSGIAVGWGERYGDQIFMPVVSAIDCLIWDPNLYGLALQYGTFCAGFKNSTSARNGDSGRGVYFLDGGSYILRGIASLVKAIDSVRSFCESDYYTVFSDVAYYLDWIRENAK